MKVVSGKELGRILERHGWQLQRMQGSHHIYSKAGIRAILSIPIHGNQGLKIGLLKHLMSLAGLTEQDL